MVFTQKAEQKNFECEKFITFYSIQTEISNENDSLRGTVTNRAQPNYHAASTSVSEPKEALRAKENLNSDT